MKTLHLQIDDVHYKCLLGYFDLAFKALIYTEDEMVNEINCATEIDCYLKLADYVAGLGAVTDISCPEKEICASIMRGLIQVAHNNKVLAAIRKPA